MPGIHDSAADPLTAADDRTAGAWENPLVRPYAITRGRTHSRRELGSDTLISASAALGSLEGLRPELQDIIRLCRVPVSLDEIAAALAIPVCVVDVLVDDLWACGLVTIYQIELRPQAGRHRSNVAAPAEDAVTVA